MELIWFYIVITESIAITIFCDIYYRKKQLPSFCITMMLTIKLLNWPNYFSAGIETQYFFKGVKPKDPDEN